MTKRVIQHHLEDLSRNKYSLVIPGNWVFRDKFKDYGIDAEVELFDNDGKATGLVYWIQLKATKSKDDNFIKQVSLSIETIKYYKKLDIPVLIIRYSEVHDCFYYKWAYDIDLYYAKENAKTFKIKFSDEDIWNEDSPNDIKKYLDKIKTIKEGRFKLPISISFIVKESVVNKIPRGILLTSFRIALKKFPDFVVFTSESKDSLLLVSLSGDELVISLSSVAHCTFHGIKRYEFDNFAENIAINSLLGFAIVLSQTGQLETMARILLDKRIKNDFFKNQKILFRLFPLILRTSYFGSALNTVSDIIFEEQDNLLESVTKIAMLFEADINDENKSNKIEAFLKKCLKKYLNIGEKTQIGICQYNLGNHYRSRRLNKKAIYHYLQARKYEEKYLNQSYYFQELGGVLFQYQKYHFSASMYKKALEKGAPESAKSLYADALMYSGCYKLALNVFNEYLNSCEVEHDEWHLKKICLEKLVISRHLDKQARKEKEAINIIDITKANEIYFEKLLESAIDIDALCGLAWFNLGILKHKRGKHEDATYYFTFCGLIQTWDIEAWVNAVLCCLNQNSTIFILPLILRTGYFFNRDEFLSKLYIEFNKRFDSLVIDELIKGVESILPQKNIHEKPTIRLLGDDGIFKDIFEKIA